MDGDLVYAEGPFIGYRGHDAGRAPAPAFWLGHGLGYSTWEYAGAEVITPGVGARVGVRLTNTNTNTGTRRSREVVQVYLRLARVGVATDARLSRVWDRATSSWASPPEGGELIVARGLGDLRATLG